MARYTGPKDKLSRREGFDLFNRGNKIKRLDVRPGEHGKKRAGKQTDYGVQLREKQKAKRLYGVLERQFKNYVIKASNSKGNVGEVLISMLEKRLDNVVYRLGLAPTRPAARQFVSHGHILINGKKVDIPSFQLEKGDEITMDETLKKVPYVEDLLAEKIEIPEWLSRKGDAGSVIRDPELKDIKEPVSVTDIIEFYSR
ncbi:MAG: 30S ribosomal protein S4 [Patescibacteria group bacterium]|jgi:small subunit ribosomal protein S4